MNVYVIAVHIPPHGNDTLFFDRIQWTMMKKLQMFYVMVGFIWGFVFKSHFVSN